MAMFLRMAKHIIFIAFMLLGSVKVYYIQLIIYSKISQPSVAKITKFGRYNLSTTLDEIMNLRSKRNAPQEVQQNLCSIRGCVCEASHFMKSSCNLADYQQKDRYIFGRGIKIASTIKMIDIKLNSRSELILEEGIFSNHNTINRLHIQGIDGNSNEQIEIRTDAFQGNMAPFPDIKISNCSFLILHARSFRGEFKLTIENCKKIIILPNAFYNTSFEGTIRKVDDLRIHEHSFNLSKTLLQITDSKLDNLYGFNGVLREIKFHKCNIGSINSGAFDAVKLNSIVFKECKIRLLKNKCFTDKFSAEHLEITDSSVGSIEAGAISGSNIGNLVFSQNEIDEIHENAISAAATNVLITKNSIKHMGKKWLQILDGTNITISKNQFGEFDSINVNNSKNLQNCIFEENFITKPNIGSLNIGNQMCIMRKILFFQTCLCNMTWLEVLATTTRDLRSESYCTTDELIRYCFNSTIVNVIRYWETICSDEITEIDCTKLVKLPKITTGYFLAPSELGNDEKYMKISHVILISVIVIMFVGFSIILAYKLIKSRTKFNNQQEETTTTNESRFIFTNLRIDE